MDDDSLPPPAAFAANQATGGDRPANDADHGRPTSRRHSAATGARAGTAAAASARPPPAARARSGRFSSRHHIRLGDRRNRRLSLEGRGR